MTEKDVKSVWCHAWSLYVYDHDVKKIIKNLEKNTNGY